MKAQLTPSTGYHRTNLRSTMRIATFVIVVALIGIPLFSSSSASSALKRLGVHNAPTSTATSVLDSIHSKQLAGRISDPLFKGNLLPANPLSLVLPQGPESIVTYESTCTTPKTDFDLGETVCAKFTGAPLGDAERAARRIGWVSPYGSLAQGADITTDPQNGTYLIPTSQTQTFTDSGGGQVVVDNRGTWTVNTYSTADGSLQTSANFTVHDPATPYVDLSVGQSVSEANSTVPAGSSSVFSIIVGNRGPDAGANVVLTGAVPNDSTFVALTQTSGPTFSCTTPLLGGTGAITCTIASLAKDATATFDLAYNVNAGTANGTTITSNATISSATAELVPDDNASTKSARVGGVGGGGTGTCSIGCPDDITTPANTVDGNNDPGAVVHFSPPSGNDECGVIVVDHCNDCFFPVGTTVVTGTGVGDSCSFTVTITPAGGNDPTISCPSNQTANADSNCAASLSVGTAAATGVNVSVIGFRSDGKPMYTCDVNDTNCTRNASDAPFAAGITTITWIAYSHDAPGPYADEADEESHRIGSATCTQIMTVNDVTPPNIVAPANRDESAGASCQFTVPDYTTEATVSDNCACSSSDTTEDCQGREPIVITQSPAPGTVIGLGPQTITLTANDGSSNNGGAGNTATAQFTITVKDTTAPVITCPANITANTAPGTCSAAVVTGTATATDNCDTTPTITATRSDGQPLIALFPKGTTTITWRATDDAGNYSECSQTVTVQDNQAPTITFNGQIPSLWPPNHNYHTFTAANFISSVSDNCDSLSVSNVDIISATSDESENGGGDGNTDNDIVIAANCKSIQLRAERQGSGNGRVYTITFRLRDTSGNTTTGTAKVYSPKNPGQTPGDNGPQYSVTGNCP